MKTKILFSTMLMAAAFSACTQDEVIMSNENAANEIVGANLLGTGLSIGINSTEPGSRATAEGWVNGDAAGIGWAIAGTPADSQGEVALENVDNELYANHFYQYNDGLWETRSNIYEGWHFAYFPFQYQSKVEPLVVEVNGLPMTKEFDADIYDNAFKISAAEKLTSDNVDTKNGKLKVSYDIARVVNVLRPQLKVSKDFTDHADLKKIAITGITVNAGDKDIFYDKIKVNPSKLPTIIYQVDEDGDPILDEEGYKIPDSDATTARLDQSLYGNALASSAENRVTSITTEIEGEEFVLDGDKNVRIFLRPVNKDASVDVEDITFRVDVEGGHFDIKYDVKDEEDETINNQAIIKMVELINGTFETASGAKRSLKTITTEEGKLQAVQSIPMELNLDNFKADYIIEDYDDWKASVNLANALNQKEVSTFTLAAKAKVEFPAGDMLVPTKGVKVQGTDFSNPSYMVFNAKTNWNENISGLDKGTFVSVGETGELSVENNLWASRIINEGTILLGAEASVGEKDGTRFDNTKGRVVVSYGAYVYPTSGQEGIIAYEITGKESASQLNNLINPSDYVRVNTFVINKSKKLNLAMEDEGTQAGNDPYNPSPSTPGVQLAAFDNINIEMKGGTIVGEQELSKNVNEILVEEGTNTILNVNIKNDLTINEGAKATIDATAHNHGENVQKHEVYVGGQTLNDGTLTVNTDVRSTVLDNEIGKIVVNKGYTFWWIDEYLQGGTATGTILQKKNEVKVVIPATNTPEANGQLLQNAIADAEEGDVIMLPAGNFKWESLGTGVMNLDKSLTIVGEEGTVIEGYYLAGSTTRVLQLYCENAEQIVLKNLEIKGKNTTPGNIWIRQSGQGPVKYTNVMLVNVKCDDVIVDNIYNNNHVIDVNLLGCDINKFTVDAWNASHPHPDYDHIVTYTNLNYDNTTSVNVYIQDNGSALQNIKINGVNPTVRGWQ